MLSEYLTDWGMAVTHRRLRRGRAGDDADRGRPKADRSPWPSLDRSMPEMDGLELKNAIVGDPASLPASCS